MYQVYTYISWSTSRCRSHSSLVTEPSFPGHGVIWTSTLSQASPITALFSKAKWTVQPSLTYASPMTSGLWLPSYTDPRPLAALAHLLGTCAGAVDKRLQQNSCHSDSPGEISKQSSADSPDSRRIQMVTGEAAFCSWSHQS